MPHLTLNNSLRCTELYDGIDEIVPDSEDEGDNINTDDISDLKFNVAERKSSTYIQDTPQPMEVGNGGGSCYVGVGDDGDIKKDIYLARACHHSNNLWTLTRAGSVHYHKIFYFIRGAGCVRHESEEKPKKKKKKRVKESRNDNKVDVQVDQNYKVEARIDEVSKNEPVKDQADDNLSSDKAVVHSSHESDMKTKKRSKDRQTSEVGDDSIIGAYKEEMFQVQEAGSKDINQEVAVKDNGINISIDKGDVQDGQESDGKVKKKKNKQAKESQANEAGDQDMIN
ncbi:hypothetical protein AQUCO_06500005v1 [Aquilegia coerulea]|uniref:Uncharacterized protein n=1 Tax=Aquilegia coerulea TaxID=218851 RepID=A0A2G5CCA3_AQUCA|nr:hypothetical protein AQUCO_06500005v1 [Aquilegia coerulea]